MWEVEQRLLPTERAAVLFRQKAARLSAVSVAVLVTCEVPWAKFPTAQKATGDQVCSSKCPFLRIPLGVAVVSEYPGIM